MRDARMRRGTKRRLLAGGLIAVLAFVLLGAALVAYERSSRKREEIGDSGSWNQEQEETAEEVSAVPEEPGEAAATDIPPETQPTEREPLENDISSRT